MRGFATVLKRELKAYFTTPVAYVFLVVFLFFAGYMPFREGFFENRQADLELFFSWLPMLFLFLIPAASMRLWAEERRSGTIELLLTLPITIRQAVLGKLAAAWVFIGIALLLTLPMPITLWWLGKPDNGPILCGYVGAFLLGGSFLAIGCFFSALSKNQVISFILTAVVCALLVFFGLPSTMRLFSFLPAGLLRLLEAFSAQTHMDVMARGLLRLQDVAYFLLMIAGWTWGCMIMLDERKAA